MTKCNTGELTAATLMLMVQEVNGWNGALEEYKYFDNNEEFFNLFYEGRPVDAVRAVCCGDYNYGDDYVRLDDWGNLVSVPAWVLEEELLSASEEIVTVYTYLVDAGHIEDCY